MSGVDKSSYFMPARCVARVKSAFGEITEARCFNVRATSLSIVSQYVPQFDEELTVCIEPPDIGGRAAQWLTVRARVCMCEALGVHDMYELGLEILEVLPPGSSF